MAKLSLPTMGYTDKNMFSPSLHMFSRESIPIKDQVAVQFCLTSTAGLASSSSACFSLSFFFFFFLTGSSSSTVVSSVEQKEEK